MFHTCLLKILKEMLCWLLKKYFVDVCNFGNAMLCHSVKKNLFRLLLSHYKDIMKCKFHVSPTKITHTNIDADYAHTSIRNFNLQICKLQFHHMLLCCDISNKLFMFRHSVSHWMIFSDGFFHVIYISYIFHRHLRENFSQRWKIVMELNNSFVQFGAQKFAYSISIQIWKTNHVNLIWLLFCLVPEFYCHIN